MKSQFKHDVISSFYLWFEKQLVSDDCSAYLTDQPNTFSYTQFNDLPTGFYGYQGMYRQLVAEYDVSKPNSGVFISGNFVSGSNVSIDYNNGRVILPRASGTGLTITANSTVKEINVYLSEEDAEQLLVTSDFIDSSINSSYLFSKDFKRDEKTFILPACFIKQEKGETESVCLGGEVSSKSFLRVVVLASDHYLVDGVLSFFEDKKYSCIKLIDFADNPYGRSYTLKQFPYLYSNLEQYSSLYVENVVTSKVTQSLSLERLQKNLILGFIDFELSNYRYLNS